MNLRRLVSAQSTALLARPRVSIVAGGADPGLSVVVGGADPGPSLYHNLRVAVESEA